MSVDTIDAIVPGVSNVSVDRVREFVGRHTLFTGFVLVEIGLVIVGYALATVVGQTGSGVYTSTWVATGALFGAAALMLGALGVPVIVLRGGYALLRS